MKKLNLNSVNLSGCGLTTQEKKEVVGGFTAPREPLYCQCRENGHLGPPMQMAGDGCECPEGCMPSIMHPLPMDCISSPLAR